MMTMRYFMCMLVLFAALSISISESISSEHSRRETGGDSQKRNCNDNGIKRDVTGCNQHSDCHHCSDHKRQFCFQGRCHCTDSECLNIDCSHHCNALQSFYCSRGRCHCGDVDCQNNSDCNHHCRASEKSMCLHGRCSCIETTITTSTTTTTEAPTTTPDPTTVDPLLIKCTNHTECSSLVCPAGKHPYCSFGQRSTDCQCTDCTDNSHCFCPAGLVGKCHFNYFDRSYSCICGLAPDTTTQPKDTTTVSPTTAQHGATTTQQTTLALGMRSCHICGDNDNGIPCDTRSIYTGNVQQCGPGEDFCMTDLIHNGQPFPSIFKRCVTEKECQNKWLVQTSDLEFCINYGNVLVEGPFNCHFCCTSDGCNSNQIPEKSTLYIFKAATTTSFKNTAVPTPASSSPPTTLHITKTTNLLKTPDPTTVDPQLPIKCIDLTECSSHVCPAGKHPYCSFGQHSTDCQCTVCTYDSHCHSPVGLVGKCHFNNFDRSYSCVYGIAPDTTTAVLTTKTTTTTTNQTSGKPCPFCDTDLNCVWNQTCSDSETCMVGNVFQQGFKSLAICYSSSKCRDLSTKSREIFCCDDRGCLERYLPGV